MPLYLSEDIIQAARAIRPYLVHLLSDQTRADKVGEWLDTLLAQAQSGVNIDNLILDAIAQNPEIREWMNKALKPVDESALKGDPRLPGKPGPVPATQKFICQENGCTFTWTRRYATQPVPPCPQHNRPLDPAP